jgi:acetyl esterase
MNYLTLLFASVCLSFSSLSMVQGSEVVIYKKVADQELKLMIDKPANWQATDKNPAIVFFFGGGWVGGAPSQFAKQSLYFASRGMVGICVQYRVIPKGDKGPPVLCCADAKSAIRYVRAHAAELGIDPDRIAGAGGSAGGHLATFTALVDGQDDPLDDKKISCKPNALVLFNPVFNNGPGEWGHERVGDKYLDFSPAHHVKKGAPPTIVFLGDKDDLILVKVVEEFQKNMKKVDATCEAFFYKGCGHGFFNTPPNYQKTVIEADKFLAKLKWITGPPTMKPE